jgi:hypothetical protein
MKTFHSPFPLLGLFALTLALSCPAFAKGGVSGGGGGGDGPKVRDPKESPVKVNTDRIFGLEKQTTRDIEKAIHVINDKK